MAQLFKSFFIGGYECADMINNRHERVDLLAETGHDVRVAEDYALLADAGIRTVREGIRWSVVEKQPYVYDFSEVQRRIQAAQSSGIQQLWDICHFGFPDNLSPLDASFPDRLAAVSKAFVQLYRSCTTDPLIITPVNEVSFMSYLGGDVAGTLPFLTQSGGLVKYHLCKAAIKAIEAIKETDPAAQVMMVEPLIKVHPAEGNSLTPPISQHNDGQFEAMEIVSGMMYPELGGRPEYLDLAGFNYYYNNQWEFEGGGLCWKAQKALRNFPGLLEEAARRFGKPVVLSETGHFGPERALWLEQITGECLEAMNNGVDLRGICIYPVLDRPDWDELNKYIPCGIWGYDPVTKERFVETEYLASVKQCIEQVTGFQAVRSAVPCM